jgi:hypothetical protein
LPSGCFERSGDAVAVGVAERIAGKHKVIAERHHAHETVSDSNHKGENNPA